MFSDTNNEEMNEQVELGSSYNYDLARYIDLAINIYQRQDDAEAVEKENKQKNES